MGACSPRKFLEIRCSEIASEAILGQKHSYNNESSVVSVLYLCCTSIPVMAQAGSAIPIKL